MAKKSVIWRLCIIFWNEKGYGSFSLSPQNLVDILNQKQK